MDFPTRSDVLVLLAFVICGCGSDFDPPASAEKDAGVEASSGGSSGSSSGGAGGSVTGGSGGTSASGGSGGAAGEAGPSCPSDHRCVAPAPSGWSGPVFKTSSACSGSWSQTELTLHENLTVPPADCDCNCTPTVTCPTTMSYNNYNNFACAGFTGSTSIAPGDCKPKSSALSNGVTMSAATPTCNATVSESIPPATWGMDDTLCSGASAGGTCETSGETCLPDAGGSICIYQAGDAACPGEYPTKFDAYTGFTDTRDCPASCGCTPGGTATCTVTVFTFAGTMCTAVPATSHTVTSGVATPTCLPGSGWGVAQPGSILPGTLGTCTGQNLSPTGTATPTGKHTVCCT